MRKNYFLVTMCVLCLLSLFAMPVFSVDDAKQLKMRIAKLEAEAVNHQKAIAEYEKQIKRYKDRCIELSRENSRLKLLCKKNGISTAVRSTARRGRRPLNVLLRPEVGAVGWIGGAKIDQVLDERTATVSVRVLLISNGMPIEMRSRKSLLFPTTTGYIDGWVDVGQRSPVYGKWASQTKKFLLKGIDTSKYVDSTTIEINSYCEITGTESYRTARGAKATLFVLEPIETP